MTELFNPDSARFSLEGFGRWAFASLAGHALFIVGVVWLGSAHHAEPLLIAPGGGNGGMAIEVAIADASELVGLAALSHAASLGEEPGEPHTLPLKQGEEPLQEEGEIPSLEKGRLDERKVLTERPVVSTPLRLYSPTEKRGASGSLSALVGPSFGGGLRGGIGIGSGGGGGIGVPGGSDYGRRLQQALISYYRFSMSGSAGPRFVVTRVRISRSGRILTLVNGRLDPSAFIVRSGNPVIDSRVEGALLELDRNPIPFPADFLPGATEAVAEIYFQY